MRFDLLSRFAAAAGVASLTAAAGAQIPPEYRMPLGYSYHAGPSGYVANVDTTGGVTYGKAGRMYPDASAAWGVYHPGRAPVERIPVQYLRYYPAVWYGLPGSTLPVVAPQVHMPTDTTQLGFYYQRVPTWVPVPGMVPPPPNPSLMHGYGFGAEMGATVDGGIVNGTSINGTVTGERVISVRPLTNGTPGTMHSPSGQAIGDPSVVPVPPAPSGLPLQPPPGEPATFLPPPGPEPLPIVDNRWEDDFAPVSASASAGASSPFEAPASSPTKPAIPPSKLDNARIIRGLNR